MKPTLPRGVRWIVRLVAPKERADHVLADLEDDYALIRPRQSALRTQWWLVRETLSLLTAYATDSVRRLRDVRPLWTRDVRLVLRDLRRSPLPAIGAATMLSTGLFAILLTAGLSQSLLFRPVSALHGEALRRVTAADRRGQTSLRLSYPELEMIRRHIADAGVVSAVNLQPVVIRVNGADHQTMAEAVDGAYFSVIGTRTIVGRPLLSADDQAGRAAVTVLSELFWRRHFDASSAVVGQTIAFNGAPFTIVGVAGALGSASALGASVDAWVTLSHADPLLNRGWRTEVADRWFAVFVLPRRSTSEIETRLASAAEDLAQLHPSIWRERRLHTASGTALSGGQRSSAVMLVTILAGLAVFILATAASNVGAVLLARAAAARRQVAIHLSLGSGRLAVVRRQLIEGALLGLAGAAISIAMYQWSRRWLTEISLLPTLALRLDLRLDAPVIAITTVVALSAGMALALGPALWATRVDLTAATGESRSSSGSGLTRMRQLLVSTQVCLSFALIVGATLFMRSLTALIEADVGFVRQQLVAMDFDVEPSAAGMSDLPALAREALARAESTPGVIAAAMSNRAPIDQSTPVIHVSASPGGETVDVTMYLATARYFDTVGIPLIAGRAFTTSEAETEADVVIVNETLASRLWPEGDALDRALYLSSDSKPTRVIGVARNSKYRSISEAHRAHVYRPARATLGRTLLARTSGDPREALRTLQRTLDDIGPGLVGFFPRTLDDHLAIDLLPTRAAAGAASAVGTLALLFSGVGLYGLVAWFVELRRREIGVRMALGANPRDVRRLVVRQALATTAPGLIAGLMLAASLAWLTRAALFGVAPFDPVAFIAGVGSIAALVIAAAYLPSRRATQVDPVRALRDA